MRTVIALVTLAAAAAVFALLRAGPADAQAEAAVYGSGLFVGKGKRARLRIHNTSPDPADQFNVSVFVRNPATGGLLNASDPPRPLFAGRTIEVELNPLVATDNPTYTGPIQVICNGTGGHFRPFGPETITVEAIQTEGKATYSAVTHWVQ